MMRAALRVHQLRGDPDTIADLADAALEHVTHAELARHLLHVDRAALVHERRVARDDEQPTHVRYRRDDVFGNPVCEVFLLVVTAHVFEWQNRNRRLVWQPGCRVRLLRRTVRRHIARLQTKTADRPIEVLDGLLAEILERHGERVADMLVNVARDANPAGLRQCLHAGRDVDTVAVEIAALDHDVTEADADAKRDPLSLRDIGVAGGHGRLDLDRARNGVDHAGELDQRTVAGRLERAAAMLERRRLEDVATHRLEPRQGPLLVGLHQPGIADDVRREDGDETALHTVLAHGPSRSGLGALDQLYALLAGRVHCWLPAAEEQAGNPLAAARSLRQARKPARSRVRPSTACPWTAAIRRCRGSGSSSELRRSTQVLSDRRP